MLYPLVAVRECGKKTERSIGIGRFVFSSFLQTKHIPFESDEAVQNKYRLFLQNYVLRIDTFNLFFDLLEDLQKMQGVLDADFCYTMAILRSNLFYYYGKVHHQVLNLSELNTSRQDTLSGSFLNINLM